MSRTGPRHKEVTRIAKARDARIFGPAGALWARGPLYATVACMAIIECIPNVSEGRRPMSIERCADADPRRRPASGCSTIPPTPSHNRSVFTLAGDAAGVEGGDAGAVRARRSPQSISATHRGEHPRLGAVDVVPFVPIEGVTMDECVALAKEVGADVAERFGVPVYLYEEASAQPGAQEPRGHPPRRVRRARGEDGDGRLGARLRPARAAPVAPARRSSARGCRSSPTTSTSTPTGSTSPRRSPRRSATAAAASGYVKAMGFTLEDRGIVQVSMNLTNYREDADLPRLRDGQARGRALRRVDPRERDRRAGSVGGADVGAAEYYPAARTVQRRSGPGEQAEKADTDVSKSRSALLRSLRSARRDGAMPNARIFRYRLLRSTPSASAVRDMLPCCAASVAQDVVALEAIARLVQRQRRRAGGVAADGAGAAGRGTPGRAAAMVSPGTMIISRSITLRSSRTLPGQR